MPIEMVTIPGVASSFDRMGLEAISQYMLSKLPGFCSLSSDLLSIYTAKPAMIWISAVGRSIFIELQSTISILDNDFVFFDGEVCSYYGASCFPAIYAVTEVAASGLEEVVVDCYCDATAEAAACYGIIEGG